MFFLGGEAFSVVVARHLLAGVRGGAQGCRDCEEADCVLSGGSHVVLPRQGVIRCMSDLAHTLIHHLSTYLSLSFIPPTSPAS